ncbi:MAG: ArnT family glycosyltransferase [Planctomycetota bacterium]|jgi:hypothetical protein
MRDRTKTYIKKIWPFLPTTNKSIIYIVILCIVALLLSTKGITDEGAVSLHGDPPRHMMNGVYFYDLIKNLPLTNPIEYTLQYFARYPALSLGHHPLFLGVAEAPFYTIFGVSVFSARLTIVFFMVLAGIMWFLLIRVIYDECVAFFSSLLFVTTPFVVNFSQIVMTEIPTLSLMITATYFFYKYCELDKRKYVISFIITLILSCLSKQTAIFMLPVFLIYFFVTKGVRPLITKKGIIFGIIITLVTLSIIIISLKFSPYSVIWLKKRMLNIDMSRISHTLKFVWHYHLSFPILTFSLISICASIYQKDKRAVFFILWIISLFMLVTLTGAPDPRYAIYWIPVFCLFAATAVNFFQHRLWKIILSTMLLIITGYQFVVAFQLELDYADGYEQAASYVVANRKGESILYSSKIDTGYFVFFTRKHDPRQNMIVLRADKLLVTSRMSYIVEKRITKREEIYEILQDLGVGYVVIEDQEFESLPLEWLREEVETDRFILRKRIPIRSNKNKLRDVELAIYEYKECTTPKRGKILHMNIPLVSKSIKVKFDDLLHKRYPIEDSSGK